MRILQCLTPGRLAYAETAEPRFKKSHVVIRIHRIGSCGAVLERDATAAKINHHLFTAIY